MKEHFFERRPGTRGPERPEGYAMGTKSRAPVSILSQISPRFQTKPCYHIIPADNSTNPTHVKLLYPDPTQPPFYISSAHQIHLPHKLKLHDQETPRHATPRSTNAAAISAYDVRRITASHTQRNHHRRFPSQTPIPSPTPKQLPYIFAYPTT